MTNPTTIARSLSEAQRAMILTNDHGFAECHRGKWNGKSIVTARKLFGLGLIEKCDTLAFPTELGNAVRAAILAEREGGAS